VSISNSGLSILRTGILNESFVVEENLYSRTNVLLLAKGKGLTRELMDRISDSQVYVHSNGELARKSEQARKLEQARKSAELAKQLKQSKQNIQRSAGQVDKARIVSVTHQLSMPTYCDLLKLVKNLYQSGTIKTDNEGMVERAIFEIVGEIIIKGRWHLNYNVYRTISNYEIVHSANVALISVLIGSQMKMSTFTT